jgi:hypothetical protein
MRAPTPKGARILADLRNQNGPETLSYSQAAELLDCGKMYLYRLNKKLRAGSARAVPLPMHPQFRNKIDAGQLLDPKNGLYQRYLNSITDAEASELIMRVRRLTPSGARKALYALDVPRVKMHIVGGGYDFQEFKAALRRRSAVRPTNDYTRQVLLAWARNPETLKVPPTKRTIRPVLHMLNEGIFSMPNSRLLNASSKMLSTHRGALTGDSRYAMVPGEPARSLPLKQNTAALAALGIDPATRVDGTTLPHVMRNADRVVLGRTIVKLMQSGTLPKHLPRVTGPERAAADAALFKALRLMAPRTPGLTAIQSVLETRVSEM